MSINKVIRDILSGSITKFSELNFKKKKKKYQNQWGYLIFQSKHSSYQIFNGFQKFLFGCFNSFFLSNDCNQFLVFITWCWEYNPCTSIFPNFLDVGPSSANQEAMVLWLCTDLKGVTVSFLWHTKKNLLKQKQVYHYEPLKCMLPAKGFVSDSDQRSCSITRKTNLSSQTY